VEGSPMPLYDCRCSACGTVNEQFAQIRDIDAMVSECCGKPVERLPCLTRPAETVLTGDLGRLMRIRQFQPDELDGVRRALGPGLADCVKSDGSTVVGTTGEARKFHRKVQELKQAGHAAFL
jgi:hypothetical protein